MNKSKLGVLCLVLAGTLTACGGGGSPGTSPVATPTPVVSVPLTDGFTQSVQVLLAATSDTALPQDISAVVPYYTDSELPIAIY